MTMPVAALCPVRMTWEDGAAQMAMDAGRLVAIDPATDRPADIAPRSISGWGDVITAADWLTESQRLAEDCVADLSPMRLLSGGGQSEQTVPAESAALAEWAQCVTGCSTADDGVTTISLQLTCIDEGESFGKTAAAVIRVGWDSDSCQAVTGLYQLACTAASIHAEAFNPDWAVAMFVRRSALRVARSAEKRLPDPITWADANAALNSRSRMLAARHGIDDIRSAALAQAEEDGFVLRVKGAHGPGSKWLRTDRPLPSHVSGGRHHRRRR